MTPQSPKARAREILHGESGQKWVFESTFTPEQQEWWLERIAEQIKLAQEEADSIGIIKGYNQGFSDGQVEMREEAALFVAAQCDGQYEKDSEGGIDMYCSLAKQIRALNPHAPEEGKDK